MPQFVPSACLHIELIHFTTTSIHLYPFPAWGVQKDPRPSRSDRSQITVGFQIFATFDPAGKG